MKTRYKTHVTHIKRLKTQWTQIKRHQYQGASCHPSLTHTLPNVLPVAPVLPECAECVYMCVLMRPREAGGRTGGGGGVGLEKGGRVPIQSLLNTFVSTTHMDKQESATRLSLGGV